MDDAHVHPSFKFQITSFQNLPKLLFPSPESRQDSRVVSRTITASLNDGFDDVGAVVELGSLPDLPIWMDNATTPQQDDER
jgi:hypothetical protein